MPAPSIQEKIPIEDIKDGVVILKDGGLRAVLMVSSINFVLKSTEEQEALTYHYQGFLNSLDFPIQILIVSRKFNISNYLNLLEQQQKEQQNELLRIQTAEYIDFIRGLNELTNVMAESFYVVIPFAPIEKKEMGALGKISSILTLKKQAAKIDQNFEKLKSQLWQRVVYVSSGLESLGLRAVALNTEELIELYYNLYNFKDRK